MDIKKFIGAAFALGLATASPALATSITIADGQIGCESANNFVVNDCDTGGNDDLANTLSGGDTVEFLGLGELHGWVRDQGGIGDNFADTAEVTLAYDSLLTFSIGI